MHELENLIWKQLKEYEGRDKLTMSDLEIVHKLTDTIKNIMKIETLGEYDEGMSNRHYVRGHYSRDYDRRGDYRNDYRYDSNDYNERYDNRRYSRESVVDRLEQIMHEAPEDEKRIIKKAIQEIK